jgi:sterol desaturase/sphingolipid hydroxylase (fatty acid hydroxylase superfamily)
MNSLIHYFSSAPDINRIIILSAVMLLLWIVETRAIVIDQKTKLKHALLNGFFVFTGAPIQFLIGLGVTVISSWDCKHQFGMIYLSPFLQHPWIMLLSTFLFLDFFEYVYHLIMHKVKRFWMFHLVHHSDRIVDVSTTLREHPTETIVRLTFSMLFIWLSGAPFWIILFRQLIQIVSNVIVHSSCRLPDSVDKILSLVFITPNLHHVHHHYTQPYTDSNYGDIFSFWDRLFGTFRRLEKKDTVFGIDSFMKAEENNNLSYLLRIPFGPYRPPTGGTSVGEEA